MTPFRLILSMIIMLTVCAAGLILTIQTSAVYECNRNTGSTYKKI